MAIVFFKCLYQSYISYKSVYRLQFEELLSLSLRIWNTLWESVIKFELVSAKFFFSQRVLQVLPLSIGKGKKSLN